MKMKTTAFRSLSILVLTLLGATLNAQLAAGGGGGGSAGPVGPPNVVPVTPNPLKASMTLEGPQTLPLRDLSELRSWAKSEIRRGQISIYSPSMLPGGKTSADFAINGGVGEDEIFTAFAKQGFDFKVAEPADGLNVLMSCSSEDGLPLFVSPDNRQHVNLVSTGALWTVPDESRYVKLKLASSLPFRFKGARNARFVLRNENGNIIRAEELPVVNDKVFISSGLAGVRGELIVSGGGSPEHPPVSLVYDLQTGQQRAPASGFAALFGANVKNVFTFQRDALDLRGVMHRDNGGAVFEVRYGLPQIVSVYPGVVTDQDGNVLARLRKGALRRVEPGPTDWKEFVTSEDTPLKVPLSPGLYHLIYDVPDNLGVHSEDEEVIEPFYGEKG